MGSTHGLEGGIMVIKLPPMSRSVSQHRTRPRDLSLLSDLAEALERQRTADNPVRNRIGQPDGVGKDALWRVSQAAGGVTLTDLCSFSPPSNRQDT